MQITSWNNSFNQTAEECQMSYQDLTSIDKPKEVCGWRWERLGEKIQCSNGSAVWTVNEGDIEQLGDS